MMYKVICMIIASLCLLGCQNSVNTVSETDRHAQVQQVNDRRVITDGFLSDRLRIDEVLEGTTSMGFKQVQVKVTSTRLDTWSAVFGSSPYRVLYKFVWHDSAGIVKGDENWKTLLVHPGQTLELISVAPGKNCQDFRLELKEE